jgi:MFS family permease
LQRICGWAVDKYGPKIIASIMGLFAGLSLLLTSQANSLWQLFIVYSFLLAIGTGGVYVVRTSIITRWFVKKRGLAIGISTSGSGLGTVIMAPFATYLIGNFGWRMASIVMGLIAWLSIIPMAMLLRKEPDEMGLMPDGAEPNEGRTRGSDLMEGGIRPAGFSLSQAFQTRNFWCLGFSWLLFSSCVSMILTHIVPHSTDIGISAMKAATILSLISAVSILGRLLVGRISDRMGRKMTAIVCVLLLAVAMIWLIWSKDLWMFYLFAVVFGFFYGGFDTSTGALIGDIFGLRNIGIIMGTLSVGWSLGAAIGSAIGGLIYDVCKNYSVAFSIGVVTMLIATLLLALIRQVTNLDRST